MKFPRNGQTAWLHPVVGFEVAPGWQDGQQVRVISQWRDGLAYVMIEKPTGEHVEVPNFELDCGREFLWPKIVWIPESGTRALRYLAGLKRQPSHENMLLTRQRESMDSDIDHILDRNGGSLKLGT